MNVFSLFFISFFLCFGYPLHAKQYGDAVDSNIEVAASLVDSNKSTYQSLLAEHTILPCLGIKTNLLHGMTTGINLGVEIRFTDFLTLDLSQTYNPWSFPHNKKIKYILVHPELRYWIFESYNGHFLGANLLYSFFNAGGLDLPNDILPPQLRGPTTLFPALKDFRFQGNAFGAGFSYGYQWMISRRFNLEANIGLGYVYFDYEKYECPVCGDNLGKESYHYVGVMKAGLSLIYLIP